MNEPDSISQERIEQYQQILEEKDFQRMNRNLQRVFFDYLRYQKEGLPIDFDEIIDDFAVILEILECLQCLQHAKRTSTK